MAATGASSQTLLQARKPYDSHPLDNQRNQIRLFKLATPEHPGDGREEIKGQLYVVDLDTRPNYAALSYVWGQRTEDDPFIVCGTVKISVTRNCFAALKHERNSWRPGSYWIDAICIDQQNEAEKLDQLRLMNLIYSSAASTYIWLGYGDESISRAFAALPDIGFQEQFSYVLTANTNLRRRVIKTRTWIQLWLSPTGRPRSRPARFARNYALLEKIYSNDWLTRIWTYQEIMLAREPILIFGNTRLSWGKFMMATFYLRWSAWSDDWPSQPLPWERLAVERGQLAHLSGTYPHFNLTHLQEYQDFISDVLTFDLKWSYYFGLLLLLLMVSLVIGLSTASSGYIIPGLVFISLICFCLLLILLGLVVCCCVCGRCPKYTRPTASDMTPLPSLVSSGDLLANLMEALCHRSASHESDYNYGVRAILEKVKGESLPELSTAPSVIGLHQDLTTEILVSLSSPYPLVRAALTSRPDKPSWVVDWSHKSASIQFWHSYAARACFESAFNATPDSLCGWLIDTANPQCLQARGHVIDVVTELQTAEELQLVCRDWDRQYQHFPLRTANRPNDTSDQDLPSLPHSAPIALKELLPISMFDVDAWDQLKKHMPSSLGFPQKWDNIESSVDGRVISTFFHNFCHSLHNSQSVLFTTCHSSNHSVTLAGIAHANVKVGDKVVLLSGVPIPMIMRPIDYDQSSSPGLSAESQYMQFVSPAAVKGMMQGEYWRFGDGQSLSYISIL